MEDTHFYDVEVTWQADTKGTMSSPALNENIEVATPPEFPGGIEGVWSPEHLFTSAIASCLMTTFVAISKFSKFDYLSFTLKAKGKLEKVDGRFMMSEVELFPTVEVDDEAKESKALRIIEKADKACLISNSVKSEIKLHPQVIVREAEVAAE